MRDLVDIMGGGKGSMPKREGEDEDATESVSLVDLTLALHHDTGAKRGGAVLVSETGDEKRAVFLPHSLIEIVEENKTIQGTRKNGQAVTLPVVTVSIPDWLAKEKGLV